MAVVTLIAAHYAEMMRTMRTMTAHLVLEDGTVFPGRSVGAHGVAAGEACFTTASAGYEQAVTDPSYARQVLTFALAARGQLRRRRAPARVGTGVDGGRRCCARPRLGRLGSPAGVVALEDVDTRAPVRRLRENGAMRCALGTAEPAELHARPLAEPHLDWPRMLSEPELASPPPALEACVGEPFAVGSGPRVVVLDLGCKRSIVRRLAESGVEAIVVPGTWDAGAVLELEPAAVLVGNGLVIPPSSTACRDGARPPRSRPAVRHLPRPPARRARARPGDVPSFRSAIAGRTTPCG